MRHQTPTGVVLVGPNHVAATDLAFSTCTQTISFGCNSRLNSYFVFIDKTKGGVVFRGLVQGLSEMTMISCPMWGWMQTGSRSLLIARV